jgi:hypothetical protein
MSNVHRSKLVSLAAMILMLVGALAVAGADESRLARVKKLPDGTVSFKQIAGYTGYDSDEEYHAKIKNLTDPQAIAALKAKHFQLAIVDELGGGILGGQIEIGTSQVQFDVTGGGSLSGFRHKITMPARFEVHSAPHNSGGEIDTFDTNMYRIEGATTASDNVFRSIRLVGGTANGYPSPGQMSLISSGEDDVIVQSFFKVGFRLELEGADGGPLAGFRDTIEGQVTMRAHAADSTAGVANPARPEQPRAEKPAEKPQQ